MTEPLVDVTGARRRRARARLRRRLGLAGAAAAVVAVLGGLAWVVWGSPWLAVAQVRVSGNTLATSEQVETAAAVPLGGALAAVDTAAIEQRIVEQVPAVESVQVTRSWPDTVAVEVTEWTPKLVIELPGSYVWVAADGHTFHATTERPEGVMVAEGDFSDTDVLATLAAVAAALPAEVAAEADHITADSVDSVVITLSDRRTVVWGSAEDADLKAQVLVPLLTVDARVYDVSAPTHPTTR